MRRHIIILALTHLCASTSFAFEIKGITTGMSISQLNKIFTSLSCEKWVSDPIAIRCVASNDLDRIGTLGGYKLKEFLVMADSNEVAHYVSFYVECGISTEGYASLLIEKFGPPKSVGKSYKNYIWEKGDQRMVVNPINPDYGCHQLEISSATFNRKFHGKKGSSKDF